MQKLLRSGGMGLALFFSGCAVFNKFDYETMTIQVPTPPGPNAIAVGATDQRELIRSGRSSANYVGMTRGGFGNPFSVTTQSKKPLTEEMAGAVASSLNRAGWKAEAVKGYQSAGVTAALAQTGKSRWLLITIREWESDTYSNTELTADVTLSVLDANGKLLAAESYRCSQRVLGGDFMNPIVHARKSVLAEFSKIFSDLLQRPSIAQALR